MKKQLVYLGITACLVLAGLALVKAARDGAPTPAKDDAPPKTATSRITQVTVYPNNALVTREVEVPAGAGSMELVVNPLPENTINSTLYSEGGDGIRVLTTRFRTRPVKEDTREEVRKLEDEAKKLRLLQESLQGDVQALQQNMALLNKLETFTAASTTHATEKGKMDSDATIALAKYLMEGRGDKSREMVKLQQQIQLNNEQLEFVARKLKDLTAGSSKIERDAVIVVDKTNKEPGKIRLNYLVDAAAWRPQYKIRAGKKANDPVQLEYLAAIVQQTGEDWQGVHLVLSTAQPMLNAAPPELKMLAVSVVPRTTLAATKPQQLPVFPGQGGFAGQPRQQAAENALQGQMPAQPAVPVAIANPVGNSLQDVNQTLKNVRDQAQFENNRNKDTLSNELFNYASALEQARDLTLNVEETSKPGRNLVRAEKNEGPSVTYHLTARLTVPSRNDEQVLEVARLELTPDYFYKAVPVLSPHVYRQANLVNKTTYVLLPGEATMYHDKDFVGRMNLPLVAIGEQFIVGFGADPQLQVQRHLLEKNRSMSGGNQVLKYDYRILVSSYKAEKVKVQLWDRIPQAENETMNITLGKCSPEVCTDAIYLREERPANLLRWDLDVEPDANGEKAHTVKYDFRLEFEKQMTIGNFHW
jgi:Domain of unknown function (DUF4139)/N-terminal domain of unknown function (DUF4140)